MWTTMWRLLLPLFKNLYSMLFWKIAQWKRSAFPLPLPAHFLEFSLECTAPGILSAKYNGISLFIFFNVLLFHLVFQVSFHVSAYLFACFFLMTAESFLFQRFIILHLSGPLLIDMFSLSRLFLLLILPHWTPMKISILHACAS